MKNNLPIFPLGLVALPGSIQSLQIFEPRYVNMIKSCMSENHGFVIVLQNNEIKDFEISKKGTYVEIIDFNNLPNGLLGITVKSENKVSLKNIYQLALIVMVETILLQKYHRLFKPKNPYNLKRLIKNFTYNKQT